MEKESSILPIEKLSLEQLADFINELIDKDFPRLVQILYRLDVSEEKLKQLLSNSPIEFTGNIIAQIIMERIALREKAKSLFTKSGPIPEEEKW